MRFENHRCLVTGAAGMLGSHLVRLLLSEGAHVTAIDDYSAEGMLACGNLEGVLKHDRLRFVQSCIYDNHPMPYTVYDEVFHLASLASPPQYQANPIHTIRTNVEATLRLLNYVSVPTGKFVFASTSEVYGSSTASMEELANWGSVNSYGPRACYDESKRCGEAICYSVLNQADVKVDARVARIFNTYGPGMSPHDGRVVTNFLTQLLTGEEPTVYGNGSQSRAFCYVDDTVEAIARLAAVEDNPREPINIGNDREVWTIAEVAYLCTAAVESLGVRPLREGTYWLSKFRHERYNYHRGRLRDEEMPARLAHEVPPNDPPHRKPVLHRAKRHLDWEPTTSFKHGLLKTARWIAMSADDLGLQLSPDVVL